MITGGTDRKVAYWETYDGAQIRELDGSESGGINGMDIYQDRFVTGSSDKLIKLWFYDEGCITHIGKRDHQSTTVIFNCLCVKLIYQVELHSAICTCSYGQCTYVY